MKPSPRAAFIACRGQRLAGNSVSENSGRGASVVHPRLRFAEALHVEQTYSLSPSAPA
jgi:hypothetical protein